VSLRRSFNTIGATPQPNLPWVEDWADFWDQHRLGHMLKLTGNAGLSGGDVEKLRTKTRQLLSHKPEPSLLHGDLWGGNKSYAEVDGKVLPIIFDPATYYGDREADVAMTYLFGGFGADFYEGYKSEWPLPEVSRLCVSFNEKSRMCQQTTNESSARLFVRRGRRHHRYNVWPSLCGFFWFRGWQCILSEVQ
jgi:fructosamine-3-kinase